MNILDNRYYDGVIAEMQPFLDEQGLKATDGGFANDTKSVVIEYNEARQMYVLKCADIENGAVGEYNTVSEFLFDDSQTEKDAVAVGIDFVESLRTSLGVKAKRAAASVELPSAQKGDSLTVSGFTKRVLDVYTIYKEAYKAHVAYRGTFLYMEFFAESLVPQIKTVLASNEKKQIKKLFELLNDGYLHGDKETVNIVVASLAAAVYNDDTLKANALAMLEDNAHFKSSVENFIPAFAKNKKLLAALVK